MKTMNLEQMENLQGGWHYHWTVHVGCAIGGLVVGFGAGGAVAYGACMLVSWGATPANVTEVPRTEI